MTRMRYRLLLALWLFSDIALFVALYALAYFLRVGFILSTDFPFDRFITATAIVAPVWLASLAVTRTFALTRRQANVRNGVYIALASVLAAALFSLTYYFLFGAFFSRLLLVHTLALASVVPWAWHVLYEQFLRRALRRDPPSFPTLIIGTNREAAALIRLLNASMHPLKPVAILDGRGAKETAIDGVPVKGKLNKLEETLKTERISHLIQCSDLEQSLNLLSACRQHGVTYMLLPSVLGIVERDERIDSLEGQPVTVVAPEQSAWMWLFR